MENEYTVGWRDEYKTGYCKVVFLLSLSQHEYIWVTSLALHKIEKNLIFYSNLLICNCMGNVKQL